MVRKNQELRVISLDSYKNRIILVSQKFKEFFTDLNKYHSEALVLDLIINVYKFAKPLIQSLIKEAVESIKRILIEQLKSLKLTPISWEEAEAVVGSKQSPASRDEVSAKVGLKPNRHYQNLGLEPGADQNTINSACKSLQEEYRIEIERTSNPEIKEFFSELIEKTKMAKQYFDENPPRKPVAIVVESIAEPNHKNVGSPGQGGGCVELKAKMEGLLLGAQYMDKDQIIAEMQKLIDNY